MHIIWELEVFRKEFFVCVKICIIDETIFFDERCFRRGSHRYTFFSNPLYSFTFLVWDGLNNAFDYWPIVVDDTCKYVRIVKFFNPFVTQGKGVVYLDKIWVSLRWSQVYVKTRGKIDYIAIFPRGNSTI